MNHQPEFNRMRPHSFLLVFLLGSLVASAGPLSLGAAERADLPRPTRNYHVYVCAESDDTVSLVRFGPNGLEEVKRIPVGSFPADIEGPHDINVAPDGRHWYVAISHGQPFGTIHKYTTGADEWVGDVRVGMFPGTLDISAATGLLYAVNSDFFGDHVPSTISVVETSTMTEVEQIGTGTMPHGARLSPDGRRLYTVNMMDDTLYEFDALRFELIRRLPLAAPGRPAANAAPAAGAHHLGGNPCAASRTDPSAAGNPPAPPPVFEPTWVTAPTDGHVYVTGLTGNQVVEVELEGFTAGRRFATPEGPYNAAVTPDGALLVVTYKKAGAVGFIDLRSGASRANLETTRRVPHGVVITDDSRYAIVSVEGVGGEPGTIEVFDVSALERVAALDIGKQAGGIALWRHGR